MIKDLFSHQAGDYARYRPSYPAELIENVLQFVRNRDVAWDCATGNGQAAHLLAEQFNKVIATDISDKQLMLAKKHKNIEYINCSAEQTPFDNNSFDLITVAQAYHWFNFNAFEAEVRRVGKPGAVVSVWAYSLPVTQNTIIDSLINRFYKEITGPYWDAERRYIDEGYTTVPFNFDLLQEKKLLMFCEWSANDMVGFLRSWSSVQHFITANNYDPLILIKDDLHKHWKEEEVIHISFPLFLKCGVI